MQNDKLKRLLDKLQSRYPQAKYYPSAVVRNLHILGQAFTVYQMNDFIRIQAYAKTKPVPHPVKAIHGQTFGSVEDAFEYIHRVISPNGKARITCMS